MGHIFSGYCKAVLIFAIVSIVLNAKANDSYYIAGSIDNYKKSKSDTIEGKIRLVKEINGIKIYQYVPSVPETETGDSVLLTSGTKTSMIHADRTRPSRSDNFSILKKSPYDEINPIPSNISLPDGLIFRIQLGVYSKPVSDDTFGGLSPVSYEVINAKIKYYTGIFYSSESAGEALIDVREYGFTDSFLVPFFDGKIISIAEAKEIEYSQIKL